MVTTRNGKRTAAEAPATETETTKKQKLPVRAKGGKAAPKKASSKKDESSRPSSKKRSSLVVELRSEASPADAQEAHEQQIITGAEQPAPEPEAGEEGKVIKDSDASVSEDQEEKQTVLVVEGDDGSDSDEAPEAVSTSKAAVQAKKSAQAANKAIAEQQATQKRKRQERNARLQEQAAVRKAQEDTAAVEKSNEGGEEEEEEEETEAAQAETTGRRRLNKLDLPSELPAEYLESDSEDESGGGETDRKPRKARKLHTAEAQIARESRGPKDEVVGTTVFRVVKKEDERLAPRAQKSSVNAKKALLARGRAPVKARKGFLV
ncbi:hypothetical protein CH063_15308 [Colletotrichum higginsianum]|uniref:U3 snorna associated n=2 Tax=Colletotrichum higginsianum TaxID=80884 RepID=H1W293_COLHI|nr:hypothetical protein CH63R_03039 [Colletotrichum higginsianum IMI 349063]OBR14313.1 hypothetical protein CH63R_03039 [Colletotrichum higginsianum IMI 349063]TID02279.1 hypothetical protein CH35J_004434 [Colletotrichum higginsianum]GJC95032.1 hypothetical protein ColKHC_03858 [Colletotrichum higginsianum]CCF46606.1 hypothetical protein CH063_15308 [Colletotrichum higginsianum]